MFLNPINANDQQDDLKSNTTLSSQTEDHQWRESDYLQLHILQDKIAQVLASFAGTNPLTLPAFDEKQIRHYEGHSERRVIENLCDGSTATALVKKRIQAEYFGAGPLEQLLQNENITEIIVNGHDSIWYELEGSLQPLEDVFLSELTYRNFIKRLEKEANLQTSINYPFADSTWKGCRVHLAIPPASASKSVLTLRRHPTQPWTFERLQELGWSTRDSIEALKSLVRERLNFLVIGATGSGKTSVLNASLSDISQIERAIIIEDSSELTVPNSASTKLLTRHDPQEHLKPIDQSDLLRQALRMRPDRLIMGEIRGGEAKDLLMAFATGHSGCMGTLHAESARQALLRLEMLVQIGAPQWSPHAVRTLIWLSLQAIVVVKRNKGKRELDGIYRIASLEDVGFLIEKIK